MLALDKINHQLVIADTEEEILYIYSIRRIRTPKLITTMDVDGIEDFSLDSNGNYFYIAMTNGEEGHTFIYDTRSLTLQGKVSGTFEMMVWFTHFDVGGRRAAILDNYLITVESSKKFYVWEISAQPIPAFKISISARFLGFGPTYAYYSTSPVTVGYVELSSGSPTFFNTGTWL